MLERSSGAFDRCCILELDLGLGLHRWMTEFLGSPVAFGLVASVTRQRQIRGAVASAATPGNNMIDFPVVASDGFLVAIGAAITPFEQQILPDFGAGERPMLVLGASDSWVLQELSIETHCFKRYRIQRTPAGQALHPGHDIVYPTFQGGGQPPGRPRAVIKSGWT